MTKVEPTGSPVASSRSGRDVALFRPLVMRGVTSRNRIMMSPMCQYSAVDGVPGAWHGPHLVSRAVGGAGIICLEATHTEARGRITAHCLGIWNDTQRDALAALVKDIKAYGALAAVQLAHAGRKASVHRPWESGRPNLPQDGGWQPIGPSPIPFGTGYAVPTEMDQATIDTVVESFASAARRSREAGFDIVELHGAHGYLIHSFVSPLSNQRTDGYGGSLANRARFLMEVIDATRREWPSELPLFVRISATDWLDGGFTADESVDLARMLQARGDVDLIDCSTGGADPRQAISAYAGYQVGFAERIRREAGIATGAVGLITSAELADEIVANGRADLVLLGRELLRNPYWPQQAALQLKAQADIVPKQYQRAAPGAA